MSVSEIPDEKDDECNFMTKTLFDLTAVGKGEPSGTSKEMVLGFFNNVCTDLVYVMVVVSY